MSKVNHNLTPKAVLPGELFDIDELDRALMEADLAETADDEFEAWVAAREAEAAAEAC